MLWSQSMRVVLLFVAALLTCQFAAGQNKSSPLTPDEAAKKVDQQVTMEMTVQSSGGNRNRYLNSARDYAAGNNFTIFIPEMAVPKFAAAGVERPEEYYYGKTIQVTGTVTLSRLRLRGQQIERPQIVVNDPAHISVNQTKSGPPIYKRTHVYKRVNSLSIRADSYRFHDRPNQPVVVWIHGGALMLGHRESVPRWTIDAARENGWVIASLDYRLAPESKLPDIISDIEDAFRWIRASGPELFQADPQRVAVAGGSAGGYLTLVTGYRVEPRPVALVSLWGYGDLIGPWYSLPSPHHNSKMTAAEAEEQTTGMPVSDDRDRQQAGAGLFYRYCRQHGLWPKTVTGWDPHSEAAKFTPYMPLKNVTSSYPPTLLIHGDKDTDVPVEQSQLMATDLKKHGIEHQLLTIPGAEHGLAGAKPEEIQATYRSAADFLRKHLNAK
jgi:acetyl esterase/lipase